MYLAENGIDDFSPECYNIAISIKGFLGSLQYLWSQSVNEHHFVR